MIVKLLQIWKEMENNNHVTIIDLNDCIYNVNNNEIITDLMVYLYHPEIGMQIIDSRYCGISIKSYISKIKEANQWDK
ncbi:MAG: hypothetical protein ACOCP4_05590 [Candidatus Woesearchaeota archaeon]